MTSNISYITTTMNKIIRILFILMISSMSSFAQDDLLGTEDGAPNPGDLPVDGGLSLLLAAGAVYGGRKLLKKREQVEMDA